jgi:hypothetical protein
MGYAWIVFSKARRQNAVMAEPDWYPAWRRAALDELVEKNRRLRREFKLGGWPRYDYDLAAGTVRFSEQGIVRVMAEIEIAGTTSIAGGDWLWAWANTAFPKERSTEAERVRAFGQKHGVAELVQDRLTETRKARVDDELEGLGWDLTAVMVKVTNVIGAYCPPTRDSGRLYLTCKTIAWVN